MLWKHCTFARAKYALALWAVLALVGTAWAQGGEGGNTCDIWGYVVRDLSCSSGGCQSGTFTAPNCPQFYLNCGGFDSYHALANCPKVTVSLYYTGANPIATCQNWGQENCGGATTEGIPVSLQPGFQYRLEVCFEPCYQHTCQDCQGDYAEGTVSVQAP